MKKIMINPARKEYSASVSYIIARFVLLRMERKEHRQLNMNITKQPAVISSTKVLSAILKNFKDVSSKKQKPRKLEEEFNICADLLLLLLIVAIVNQATKVLYNI